MLNIFTGFLYFAASYLVGSFPTSAIIAKIKGVPDLTKKGSGNLGATNVARVIGKKFGLITLAVDALKGYVPAIIAIRLEHYKNAFSAGVAGAANVEAGRGASGAAAASAAATGTSILAAHILLSLIIIAPVAGHCYSAFMGFKKGGKGVAPALGVFFALSPVAVGIALAIFITVLLFSKYVSVASIVSAFFMPFLIFYSLKDFYMFGAAVIISALIIYKHSANIKRLIHGTENKIK